MKTAVDEIRLSNRAPFSCGAASRHGAWARQRPSDAIADRDDARHRDGGTGSVTANGSGCATLVAMVQASDLWKGDNVAGRGRLYRTRLGAILAEREMRAASVVILKVYRKHTAQVMLVGNDDVIETFAADRADDALDIGVLPRRSRRCDDLLDGHRLDTIAEGGPI